MANFKAFLIEHSCSFFIIGVWVEEKLFAGFDATWGSEHSPRSQMESTMGVSPWESQ